ncbi:hypothetical protein ADT32_01470 [Xylella fastidiosa]|uniref:hypothetical protein n=1 Tax=Xylella fastidiosa TaxID=2371 RepID=UPI0007659FAE|nr:hypothetical protein [Xylella fastidiosa]KXB12982.1 hypothetical protein ADT32_01470 [Xylella fastidiosa]KXB19742.1 hypothetical protein ADT31_00820 [Xylella fastidiosa]TNW25701.1 hypothetical protein EIP74_04465 [Xylella fastidiosa subsp. pauca]TNW25748.1 hypothetical protein EIP74_04750 [Xylella fastidiosa subsp. pauca]
MTLNVSEQAQPQANQALSGTQKAPLLDLGGFTGAEIEKLLGNFYFRKEIGPRGTIEMFLPRYERFNPLIRSWFEGRQDSKIKIIFGSKQECIRVLKTHPLYQHVSAAYEADTVAIQKGLLRRIKARDEAKARAAASNGVAA